MIPENNPLPTKLQPGDTVLVQNHTKGPFDPKYVGDYQVVAIKGNQIEVRPSIGGPTRNETCQTCEVYSPSRPSILNKYLTILFFGRKTTLRLNPDKIPDLSLEFGQVLIIPQILDWLSLVPC